MKVLLFGGTGQVGWELQRALAPLGALAAPPSDRVDLARPDLLRECVRAEAPTVIVNAAAYTAVDRAELEAERARAINGVAPGVLAEEAAARGAALVHYSTDYVFDGSGDSPRDEDAAVGPLNAYGHSKLAGEEAIRASGCRHLILRTSWVHGTRGSNFVKTVLRLAAQRETLDVVDDQVGAPTGADLLADVTTHLLRALARDAIAGGTYHCTAAGETSWHGLARWVVERSAADGRPLRLAPDAVHPIASRDYPTPARRPLNSRLDCSRLQRDVDLSLPPWQAGVARLLAELVPR